MVRSVQIVVAPLLGLSLFAQDDTAIVRGRAIDRDGKPVAGCAVGVFGYGAAFDTRALLASPPATTDTEGRYELRAPCDRALEVVVATKQHQVCVQVLWSDFADLREVPAALMLPGTSLRGRVRDVAGKPIAGACVHAEDPLIAETRAHCWSESTAHTDERGVFEVLGVPPTGLRLVVTALGFAGEARFAGRETPLDFTLTATGVVRGRVADADGKPLAGCVITTMTAEPQIAPQSVRSDGEGRFAISAPLATRYRVTAWPEGGPPLALSSALLHGPATDVVLTRPPAADAQRITMRCVDAATKAPIAEFRVSRSADDGQWSTLAMLDHPRARQLHRGEATFDLVPDPRDLTRGVFVLDAPGHGTVVVPIPKEVKEPLVVELPAECFLVGRVLDAETGKPAAGVAVCALPDPPGVFGSDFVASRSGVVTDAEGRYRIGSLAAGFYYVRVYAAGRPVPRSTSKVVKEKAVNWLDLEVPQARFLEVEFAGEVPDDCLGEIRWTDAFNGSSMQFCFVPMPTPRNVPLRGPRTRKIGPIGDDPLGAWLSIPMRNRVERTEQAIHNLSAASPRLRLPELRRFLHRGRVELPSDVPPERVAVVARRIDKPTRLDSFVACLACDGTFELDLQPARYALQLVDLETFIVFHTEAEDRTLDERTVADQIAITPDIHWLTIAMQPATVGSAIVDQGVTFGIARPRDELPALFRDTPRSTYEQEWKPRSSTRGRLLVPAGKLTLQATQAFEMLSRSWQPQVVDRAEIEITAREHEAVLRLPPPPTDGDIDKLAPAAGRR